MCHDWPVKKAIVNLPIRLKGNSKHISGNLLSSLGAQNKDFGAASQMLLTGVKQGAKKVSLTASHSGKMWLAYTSPQVISTSPKTLFD